MDITDYINSRDIRDYHRTIGYEYNSLEAAWIVYRCYHATLDEKEKAWKWIINNLPDREISNCRHAEDFAGKTVHQLISEYIDMLDRFLEEFESEYIGWYFTYKCYSKCDNGEYTSFEHEGCYSTYDSCLLHALNNEDPEETKLLVINRGKTDIGESLGNNGNIFINLHGQIMDITPSFEGEEEDRYLDLIYFFNDLWFDFPVPFKRGDIVFILDELHGKNRPIVLTDIIIPPGRNPEEYRKYRKNSPGDTSDMNIWGYAADIEWADGYHGVYNDVWWNYMDVEYYREELKGYNRLLKPISNWFKGELAEELDLLLAGYHHIMMEEYLGRTIPVLYTREGLRLGGFAVEGEE